MARVELGLSEAEFWRTTPAKFWAMIDQANSKVKRADYRTGVLTKIIREVVGAKNAKVFDYFPIHQKDTPKASSNASLRAVLGRSAKRVK